MIFIIKVERFAFMMTIKLILHNHIEERISFRSLYLDTTNFLRKINPYFLKVGLSPSKKNDEKCFLFHLKSSFCSRDI